MTNNRNEWMIQKAMVKRDYSLNMPHMALGGMSESWLFKEFGDIHWTMLSEGLGQPSSKLADANGDRLYATFTRIYYTSSVPIKRFSENEEITATAKTARFGGGVFFSDLMFGNRNKQIKVHIMSSFTKRSNESSNLSLLKGQPVIPPSSPVPELSELPEFAMAYRQMRSREEEGFLFECTYDIQPYHDINGVGLLYFAAYPTISDLCEMRYFEQSPSWSMEMSTISRDIYFFGNCDMNDKILYRLHEKNEFDESIILTSTLARMSDGMTISHIITSKAQVN